MLQALACEWPAFTAHACPLGLATALQTLPAACRTAATRCLTGLLKATRELSTRVIRRTPQPSSVRATEHPSVPAPRSRQRAAVQEKGAGAGRGEDSDVRRSTADSMQRRCGGHISTAPWHMLPNTLEQQQPLHPLCIPRALPHLQWPPHPGMAPPASA